MKFTSTRSYAEVDSAKAIASGIAPDGGLYTPVAIPKITHEKWQEFSQLSYSQLAAAVLSMYMDDFTREELEEYARLGYDTGRFLRPGTDSREPVGLCGLNKGEELLQLYFGPTAAFKDMALQLMPRLLTASLKKLGEKRTVCILVATSGDTGKAALEGFRDVEGTQIGVYYPNGGVSAIQRLQMASQEGNNVKVWAVEGNFDDCQTGVKKIFTSDSVRETVNNAGYMFSSANSINWGRLAPQIVYYIWTYLRLQEQGKIAHGEKINICVPSGNFGNILAAYLAKRMGLPVNKLICASNINNVLTDFVNTGVYDRKRQFYKTLSPSMDILVSSNVERLLYYLCDGDCAKVSALMAELNETGKYTLDGKALEELKNTFCGSFCDDDATCATIKEVWDGNKVLIDTHTAVGVRAVRDMKLDGVCVIASTASAYKFADGVLGALGDKSGSEGFEAIDKLCAMTGEPVPAPLDGLRSKSVRFEEVIEKDGMEKSAVEFCR